MDKNIIIKKTIVNTQEYDIQINGITLLSDEEYEAAKKHIKPIYLDWWLRTPGDYSDIYAKDVGWNNSISHTGAPVFNDEGVRPALKINLNDTNLKINDSFEFSDYTWTVISDNYALCDNTLCLMPFKHNAKESNENNYEESDVKEFIESWLANRVSVKASSNKIDTSTEIITEIITKQAVIDAIMSEPMNEPRYPAWWADKIKSLPPIESERSKGEWVYLRDDETRQPEEGLFAICECSNCGKRESFRINREIKRIFGNSYCRTCGADMKNDIIRR